MNNNIQLKRNNRPTKSGYYVCQEYYTKELIEIYYSDCKIYVMPKAEFRSFLPETLWSDEIIFSNPVKKIARN